jgi:two-component system phosphate regulon sensor histidine kinase PhoR
VPNDEIGRLGRALNRMADGLQDRYRELAAGRDERERILAHLADGVALLDSEGAVLHANPGLARLLGLAQTPPSGARFHDVVRQPALMELLERARGGADARVEELRLFTPGERMVEATVVNLGPQGGFTSQLLVLHDLSRIKQLERVRQEFVANVSHELRTPLTLIRGCAETLLDGGLEDSSRRREFVETLERHSARLQSIVEDLLELARLDQTGTGPRLTETDLLEIAKSVCGAFEAPARRKGLTLSLRSEGRPLRVLGEATSLERALFNLMDNAVKYTESGSAVISLGRESGTVWCEVRDTGPGIESQHLPRLFERFYRVDQGRSRELGGTGLGLSIVRHAVEQMGGRVSAASEPGRGSVFRIELPAAPG